MTFETLVTPQEIELKEVTFLASILKDTGILLDYPQLGTNEFFTSEGKLLFEYYSYCSNRVTIPTELEYSNFLNDLGARASLFSEYNVYAYHTTIKDFTVDTNFEVAYLDWTRLRVLKKLSQEGYKLDPRWKKMDIDDIYGEMDANVQEIFLDMATELKVATMEKTTAFLDELDEGLDAGMSYASFAPITSFLTDGVRLGEVDITAGFVGTGKSTYAFTNKLLGLMKDNPHLVSLVIANEMEEKAYIIQALAMILYSRFNIVEEGRRQIKNGKYTPEFRKLLELSLDIWNKEYACRIRFVKVYDYNMKIVSRLAKQHQKLYGTEVVLLDTLKAENAGEWAELVTASKDFYQLCSKIMIAGMVTVQMKLSSVDQRIITMGDTGGAKDILQVASEALYLRPAHPDEIDPESKTYCQPIVRRKNAKGVTEKLPLKLDPQEHKKYLIGFHVKTRSEEVGTQVLYKFLGKHAVMQEIGTCTVVEKAFSKK